MANLEENTFFDLYRNKEKKFTPFFTHNGKKMTSIIRLNIVYINNIIPNECLSVDPEIDHVMSICEISTSQISMSGFDNDLRLNIKRFSLDITNKSLTDFVEDPLRFKKHWKNVCLYCFAIVYLKYVKNNLKKGKSC